MINIGVAGVGHLGKIHLRLLRETEGFALQGFYDANAEHAAALAAEIGLKAFASLQELLDAVDALVIATPTLSHHEVATKAVKQGKHIFIEKPLTSTVQEARSLLQLIEEAGVKAQVGHVERFNPAFLAIQQYELNPMFIEVHRLAQWNPRGTDVSVVFDLMIHDIDLILHLVKAGVQKISASGVAVLTDTPDIANARIEFLNGCVANLTASRISMKNMRKLRMFQKNSYVSLDLSEKAAEVYSLHHNADEAQGTGGNVIPFEHNGQQRFLSVHQLTVPAVNSIQEELRAFGAVIRGEQRPPVSVLDAYDALNLAQQIQDRIQTAQ